MNKVYTIVDFSKVERFAICPKCKERAGYYVIFDFNYFKTYKCECGKGLKELRKL